MAATLASTTPGPPSSAPNAAATGAFTPRDRRHQADHDELHRAVEGGDDGERREQRERGVASRVAGPRPRG